MYIPKEISELLSRLESHGYEAFVVGGCVRDSLLGIEPADWDICTSARPEEIQHIFEGYSVIPTGIKHGTLTILAGNFSVEITTYRKDGIYLDNRHPDSVTYTPNIQEDLIRRDFTVNAMAYSPKRGLLDFHGGQAHLKEKLLCCVGNPQTRFTEDALRILRGLRFAAVYGLTIEPKTALAIHDCRKNLECISAERIYSELKKLLISPDFSKILAEYPDILATIFPAFDGTFLFSDEWKQFMHKLSSLPASFPLRLSSIFYWCKNVVDYRTLCELSTKSLKPDKHTYKHFMTLLQYQDTPLPQTLPEIRRFIGSNGSEILLELLEWRTIQFQEINQRTRDLLIEIQEHHHCCNISELDISGNDLKERGLSGLEIGKALSLLLEQVIDGNLPNEKNVLLNFLFS